MVGIILMGGTPAGSAKAQQPSAPTRTQMDSIVNPPLAQEADKLLRFDSTVLRIGTMADTAATRSCAFHFINVSRRALQIAKVTTNCGCTTADYPKAVIAPGAKGTIYVSYNPKNRPGTVDTNAFVYLRETGTSPAAKLTLLGNVTQSDVWDYLPARMGSLRLKRKEVRFSGIRPGTRPEMRILCANTGSRPLKLTASMLPSYAHFRTEPEIIAPGKEADLIIRIDTDFIKGKQFSFLIEGVKGRLDERTLTVLIDKE